MLNLHGYTQHFSYPEVHKKSKCQVVFKHVLRVQDVESRYFIPPYG